MEKQTYSLHYPKKNKRMRYLLLISPFFFVVNITHCQVNKNVNLTSNILSIAIQSEEVKREFKICDFECNRLDLFDFNNVINDRPINLSICGKQIYQYNTQSLDHPTPNSIVVYRLDKNENGSIKIYLLRPYTGAAVIQTYEINGKIKLVETQIGTF